MALLIFKLIFFHYIEKDRSTQQFQPHSEDLIIFSKDHLAQKIIEMIRMYLFVS